MEESRVASWESSRQEGQLDHEILYREQNPQATPLPTEKPPLPVPESSSLLRDELVDKVWEDFVTDFLLGSCHIQKAAIFDLATRRPLTDSDDLNVRPEEMEQLVASLQNVRLAYRNGVTLNGKTYKVHLADGRNGILARSEEDGCTVCKTHTLVIIGFHDARGSYRICNETVMRLGDFFRRKAV